MAAAREEDIEFEDGECSDSGDDCADNKGNSMVTKTVHSNQDKVRDVSSTSYRSQIPQIVINSDDSGNDSEDDYPSVKRRSNSAAVGHQSMHSEWNGTSESFVNPLLSEPSSSNKHKKKNSIWGSVLAEQDLSHDIKSFGVEKLENSMKSRDVESYDFRKAKEDDRPEQDLCTQEVDNTKEDIFADVVDLEDDVKRQERQNRKRKAKDRLGRRSYNKHKARDLQVTEDSEKSEVVKAITDALKESNIDLFTRIVDAVGNAVAIKMLHMTEDIESAGGMMTNDGYRRRTPGGTYIQLIKTDALVTKDQLDQIFAEDEKRWRDKQKEKRKIKRAARRRWLKQKKQAAMDLDRPETPTPPEDFEVGEILEGNNDSDLADLPERPATPEPKDDSSDGESEESEEEEDISVAIAKAKAALLKKQREMAASHAQETNCEMSDITDNNAIVNEPVLELTEDSGSMFDL